jgi:hypothetical protein
MALCLLATAAIACTSPHAGFQRASTSPIASTDILGEAEIATIHAVSAYDAVQRLRPTLLTWTRAMSPLDERVVIVDGVQLGGLESLKAIPADAIHELRLFSPLHDVGPYRAMSSAGALVITTRTGPRR